MGLYLVRFYLTLFRDIAGKPFGVTGGFRDLDMLNDDRWMVASIEVHTREGALVIPKRLYKLDLGYPFGLSQLQDSIAYGWLHKALVLKSGL